MKEPPKLRTLQMKNDEINEIAQGRQRYIILFGDLALQAEPGDFVLLNGERDKDFPQREPDQYVVCITQKSEAIPELDGEYRSIDEEFRICSVAKVTQVALKLLEAALRMQQQTG